MYKIGDWVFDRSNRKSVRIIDINELWDCKTFNVYEPISKESYFLNEDNLKKFNNVNEFNLPLFKYIVTASRINNELANEILSSIGGSIIPLPHQVYALNRALSSNKVRYMIADEVGLGKTIEAGLILKELKTRGLINRILIVCPNGLMSQWHDEMKTKFDEDFKMILPKDFETLKRINGTNNVWKQFSQVICSLDSIKPLEKRSGWDEERIKNYNRERIENITSVGWDLIIIDEAHRIGGSSSEVARYKLGSRLAEVSPYLLLLTATPHQGKTEPFLRLIRLLDKEAFPDSHSIVKEQVAPYIIRTEKREAVDGEGNKLFKERNIKTVKIEWDVRHNFQQELYERVTEYVVKGYNKAQREKKNYIGFLMVLMQRLVTSSTSAIKANLEKRLTVLENDEAKVKSLSEDEFWEMEAEDIEQDIIKVKSMNLKKEINELKSLLMLATQVENQYIDSKAEILLEYLYKLQLENENFKVIIFTEFVKTQEFLRDFLEGKDFNVATLNGSMGIDERNEVLAKFKNEADILISTDAGGEGLNLQFCNILINYDLPWNPMKIEQRIGRIDRIGQKRDVFVFNFMLSGTVEFRVKEVLEEKLNKIFEQFGVDKMGDVLDSVEAEMDFTEVYIKSLSIPKNIDYRVNKIENEIKEKTRKITEVKDLLRDEKIIDTSLVSSLKNSPIETWIKQMFINKCLSEGKEINFLDLEFLSLNNKEVKNMLYQLPTYIKRDQVPSVFINDCSNEKGYWSLWEININEKENNKKIFPVFINENGIIRIASSNFLWDKILDERTNIEFKGYRELNNEIYGILYEKSKDIAYNYFSEMKDKFFVDLKKEKEKYEYVFKVRKEAAKKIGLETVRNYRLKQVEKEESIWSEKIENKNLVPILKPIYIVHLE